LTDKIHSRIPHSKVIWYDSMTKDGDIKWQNTLNDMNEEFFGASDGLFVNYFWKVDTPPSAYEYATNLGRHGSDIYFGNDVWGRGSFASGFETWKASDDDKVLLNIVVLKFSSGPTTSIKSKALFRHLWASLGI
jgi:endo-beta-N-acetylglucosaminidase D